MGSGKWKDWKIKEVEKFYSVFSYLLVDPQQESCVLRIYNLNGNEKRILLAYTIEEINIEVYPAALNELYGFIKN
jgi:hypothetical protein